MPTPPAAISIRAMQPADRAWAAAQFTQHFGGAEIASRDVWFDTTKLPGFVALDDAGALVGAVVHTVPAAGRECEVIALVSVRECRGVGTALLQSCVDAARAAGASRIFLTTSNDNLPALLFYQKRGWRIVAVHRDSITRARQRNPEIPLHGHDGILIADEIELEYVGSSSILAGRAVR